MILKTGQFEWRTVYIIFSKSRLKSCFKSHFLFFLLKTKSRFGKPTLRKLFNPFNHQIETTIDKIDPVHIIRSMYEVGLLDYWALQFDFCTIYDLSGFDNKYLLRFSDSMNSDKYMQSKNKSCYSCFN